MEAHEDQVLRLDNPWSGLGDLLAEIVTQEEKDDLGKKLEEVQEGDIDLGAANDQLQRLFCLADRYEKLTQKLVNRLSENAVVKGFSDLFFGYLEISVNREEFERTIQLACLAHAKAKALKNLAWVLVRDIYGAVNAKNFSICSGWQIVRRPSESGE